MLFGFAAFAERPFSTVADDGNVTITAAKNELTITIGSPGITADSLIETLNPNPLTLGTGTVTITAGATVAGVKNELVLGTGTVTISADADVTAVKNELVISSGTVTITADALVSPTGSDLTLAPGATMTWTPIDTSA